jgi:uncharacterized membrane protein YhaH (DUF805 family)
MAWLLDCPSGGKYYHPARSGGKREVEKAGIAVDARPYSAVVRRGRGWRMAIDFAAIGDSWTTKLYLVGSKIWLDLLWGGGIIVPIFPTDGSAWHPPCGGRNDQERIQSMSWFVKCLQNYVTFSGRARRKEFWMFYLFYTIFGLVICFIQGLAGMEDPMLLGIYVLAMCLPAISVLVRRLHDIDKSGWWVWIAYVPVVGGIILLVFECMEGTKGTNRFGPDPKAVEAAS